VAHHKIRCKLLTCKLEDIIHPDIVYNYDMQDYSLARCPTLSTIKPVNALVKVKVTGDQTLKVHILVLVKQ
jgi:hypothetical protein